MSNQFNYELDERHIRILMQNAELKYDESAWEKFQAIPVIEQRQAIGIALPKINFGISRSVIVPVFFVLMIGGLSAVLFSFVDFKKKEEVEKIYEKTLNILLVRLDFYFWNTFVLYRL